jgi:magnesium transporter
MQGILTSGGTQEDATREAIEKHLRDQVFFWLDLDGIDDETHDLLANAFNIHRLALNHAQEFGQRPKVEDFDGFVYMVVHGASSGSDTTGVATDEVHFILADHYVVTIHYGACLAMDSVHDLISQRKATDTRSPQAVLVYLIINQLVDSFFPMLDTFDTQIDELEDAILVKPTNDQLGQLFTMKRTLIAVRKQVTPERDMFASITSGVAVLPGVGDEGLRYMRDIYDHLIRISDLVDGYRDLLSSVMDTHLSTVSNRLNVVMKQLTIIATVFLPLSFLTGFFGQNFSFLVRNIEGPVPFYVLGIGFDIVAAAGLLYLFKRRGWLGGDSS